MHETAGQPKKEGQISKESAKLAVTIKDLRGRVLYLQEIILPVLKEGPPEKDICNEAKIEEPLVQIAGEFNNCRMEIIAILDIVNSMISRVEL